MPLSEFDSLIKAIAKVHGYKPSDADKLDGGLYFLRIDGDLCATCNSTSTQITFQDGPHHTYQVPIANLVGAI